MSRFIGRFTGRFRGRFSRAGQAALAITSASAVSNTSGTVLAHALSANQTVSWSIVGGADQAKFEISGSTLRWTANGTQNYAAPADADTNNTYIVTVRATNGVAQTVDQTITVTVVSASSAASLYWFMPVFGRTA